MLTAGTTVKILAFLLSQNTVRRLRARCLRTCPDTIVQVIYGRLLIATGARARLIADTTREDISKGLQVSTCTRTSITHTQTSIVSYASNLGPVSSPHNFTTFVCPGSYCTQPKLALSQILDLLNV